MAIGWKDKNGQKRAIYGLFDASGVCFYIGQTASPKTRERQWSQHRTIGKMNLRFTIIEWGVYPAVHEREGEIITEFRAKGQAQLNKTCSQTPLPLERIKHLRIGQATNVKDESQRAEALIIGKALGYRIATKRSKLGYTVIRLPE